MKKNYKTSMSWNHFIPVLRPVLIERGNQNAGHFGDNMVLQQQSEAAIWGWAKANTSVRVTTSWNKKSYSAKSDGQGYWKLKVKTPAAGYTPYTITISDGKAVTLNNILIGEVWVCSGGQSNMEMPMKGFINQPVEGGPEAIATSRNHGIRCFTMKKLPSQPPLRPTVKATGRLRGPETTPDFTATGYYFGRLLNQTLDVPVGLIHTSWGRFAHRSMDDAFFHQKRDPRRSDTRDRRRHKITERDTHRII